MHRRSITQADRDQDRCVWHLVGCRVAALRLRDLSCLFDSLGAPPASHVPDMEKVNARLARIIEFAPFLSDRGHGDPGRAHRRAARTHALTDGNRLT